MTWAQLPFRHGADADPEQFEFTLRHTARPIMPANVLALPSAAVPAGLVDDLPVGVVVTGPRWGELLCLDVAGMVEASGLAPETPIDPRF